MDVIGDLLRAGLLTQIGDHEDRVTLVRSASTSLATRFGSDLRPLVPKALVAGVDETTAVGSETMKAADEALLAEWATCRNVFPEPPAEILRAMLLGAVATAAEKDSDVLAAGWYSLRSAVELVPTSRWAGPLSTVAATWDDVVWDTVAAAWSPVSASSKVRMPAIASFEEDRIRVNSGARDQAKAFFDSGNYNQFAQTMQASYVDHVNELLSASEVLAATAHKRSIEALRSFAGELGTKLREVLVMQERSIDSMRLRSDLIWWQQTGFSPSLRVGYSTLNPVEAAIVAAIDLHELMPPVAPLAAEHLLFELVSQATGNPLITLDELSAADSARLLPEIETFTPPSLLDAVVASSKTPLLGRDHKVKPGRLAVLLFRELQAVRLTRTTAPSKP